METPVYHKTNLFKRDTCVKLQKLVSSKVSALDRFRSLRHVWFSYIAYIDNYISWWCDEIALSLSNSFYSVTKNNPRVCWGKTMSYLIVSKLTSTCLHTPPWWGASTFVEFSLPRLSFNGWRHLLTFPSEDVASCANYVRFD